MKEYLTIEQVQHSLSNLHLLTFEVTDACNLKCKYCGYGEFYEDYDERENRFLRVDYAKNKKNLQKIWQFQNNFVTSCK
jgi:uncharacterized protein